MAGPMTRAQIARRETRNTPGFVQPALDHPPAQPGVVARNEHNPRLVEPPPAGFYALRPVETFKLETDPNAPRAVTEADLTELFEWGLPLYAKSYPAATAEGMLPLVRRACMGAPYRALRTPDACAIFMADQKPWMAKPIVFDIFIVWKEPDLIHQAVKICRVAREWARAIGAAEFQLIECDENLAALAARLGMKPVSTTHSYGCAL